MRRVLGAVIATGIFVGDVCAADVELLCQGSTTLAGDVYDHSFVLELETASGGVSLWTQEGTAAGLLRVDAQKYFGHVFAESGNVYSASLDRFSGDLLVIRVTPPPADSKATFWGRCQKQPRLF